LKRPDDFELILAIRTSEIRNSVQNGIIRIGWLLNIETTYPVIPVSILGYSLTEQKNQVGHGKGIN